MIRAGPPQPYGRARGHRLAMCLERPRDDHLVSCGRRRDLRLVGAPARSGSAFQNGHGDPPLATLSRRYGLLFIHGRATASTAVHDAMESYLEGERLPKDRMLGDDGQILVARHSNLPTLIRHGCLSPQERTKLLVFATVRNPFDQLVSHYSKMRAIQDGRLARPNAILTETRLDSLEYSATHPFEQWILSHWRRPGLLGRFRGPRPWRYSHTKDVDHVLRFEQLQEDFSELLTRVGYEGTIELHRVNPTPGRERDYRRYYTPRARRHVERAWRAELARYGYGF